MKFNHAVLPITLLSAALVSTGCSDSRQPSEYDRARADPMNYKPTDEWPDVSGGSVSHFDKKAFNKDLNDVLNP